MPRRNNKGSSGVRGPNSALTEFLKAEGITDAFRRRREREESSASPQPDSGAASSRASDRETSVTVDESATPSPSRTPRRRRVEVTVSPDASDAEEDAEVAAIKQAAREKRRRAGSPVSDDDYSDAEDRPANSGEPSQCCECGEEFILSAYSPYLAAKQGYLCPTCAEVHRQQQKQRKKNQFAARKRRKAVASALLDKRDVKFPTLQDLCIKEITVHIDDVDQLGDIGGENQGKICRILSKNRSLTDKTVPLFLGPQLTTLQLWDCSNVSRNALAKIPAFCPELEDLTLFMCGQLHNENMEYFASNLPKLRHLRLNGPFLINSKVWEEYLTSIPPLDSFELRNTHRFTNENLVNLLESMGATLSSLKLSRLDGITAEEVYDMLPHYCTQLTELELSFPHTEDIVTDDMVIELLKASGDKLTSVNLDGCTSLSERILLEGILPHCPNITHLSLRWLDLISDEGMASFFDQWSGSGGLLSADFTKCYSVGDEAVYALWKHSGRTLVELSLNSVPLSKDFLLSALTPDNHPSKKPVPEEDVDPEFPPPKIYAQITLPLLTTLDMGFVRAVDDEVIRLIDRVAPKLAVLEVYGDNRVTQRAYLKSGTLLIGRQLDSEV
ncbi:DNA repair protein Rad7p [Diutina catenulata]